MLEVIVSYILLSGIYIFYIVITIIIKQAIFYV